MQTQVRLLFGQDLKDPKNVGLRAQVIYLARNPNPGGEFYLRTRDIRNLSDDDLIAELIRREYDALLLFIDGRLAAMAAYERKWDGPHVFLLYLPEERRRKNVRKFLFLLLREFILLFYNIPRIQGIVWGRVKEGARYNSLAQAIKRINLPFPVIVRGNRICYADKK